MLVGSSRRTDVPRGSVASWVAVLALLVGGPACEADAERGTGAPPASANEAPEGAAATEAVTGQGAGGSAGTSEGDPHGAGTGADRGEAPEAPAEVDGEAALLAAVARVHGRAGPYAVAGYRMGAHALRAFGAERGDRTLVVEHHTPQEVRYSCIADGVQAATGVSMGQLTLTLVDAAPDDTHTVVRRKDGGAARVYRLREDFEARMDGVPPDGLVAAGAAVAEMPEDAIFTVTPLDG